MKYKENHYVPRWYQERFLPPMGERRFYCPDLVPEQFGDQTGPPHKAHYKWVAALGASSGSKETDLYTVKYGTV